MRLINADELYRIVKTECNKYGKPTICFECGNKVLDLIDNAPTVDTTCQNFRQVEPERPQGEYVDISKLRLMTVEECAGHTIDYAMGWKACVEWIKKGGAE